MSFTLGSSGSFNSLEKFLRSASKRDLSRELEKYGREGVAALSKATPLDTGETKNQWDYKVEHSRGSYSLSWFNGHLTEDGSPVVIMLQYGHGTGTGGYVKGRDFINPAMKPIFDTIADNVWKAVTSA